MSAPNPSPRRAPSPWLWLLLVPVALILGRVVGGMNVSPVHHGTATESAAAGGVRWTSLADAEAEAKRTGKPVLYDFNADWCPPCQAMKHQMFENPADARAIEAVVVPVSVVDRYKENGANPPEIEALQQRFQIYAFPTLIVLSPTTGRFVKREGFDGAASTREWIAQAAASLKSS